MTGVSDHVVCGYTPRTDALLVELDARDVGGGVADAAALDRFERRFG